MKIIIGFLLLLAGLAVLSLIKANKKEQEFNLDFYQNDYQLKLQRAELNRYNKELVKYIKVIPWKYNRTLAVVNFTVVYNIDIGNDLVGLVQVYKFMSNEYRYFPIRVAANWCKALAANVAGMNKFLSCGNFTGCPVIKGQRYHICKFTPDQAKLPPLMPEGDYKIEMHNLYLSQELHVVDAYISITRPIPIPP